MSEPVTLDEVRLFCRVDDTTEDALMQGMIVAARQAAEDRCHRGMTAEDWPDGFPWKAKLWILMQVATFFANREATTDKPVNAFAFVDHLLDGVAQPDLA